MDYTESVLKKLRKAGIRAEVDARAEKVGRKIRDAELSRVPYMFIVGEKEEADNTVSVRVQGAGEEGQGDLGAIAVDTIIAEMAEKISERSR
jgi:threonyl-tRNA synthetase